MQLAKRSRTIDRAIAAHPGVIAEVWAEAECAYPWWVLFKPGFTSYDNPGQHSYNGTATAIAEYIRGVRPCNCEDCRKEKR